MHEQGLLDEIRTLNEQGLQEGKTASRAIGYAQFARALEDADQRGSRRLRIRPLRLASLRAAS